MALMAIDRDPSRRQLLLVGPLFCLFAILVAALVYRSGAPRAAWIVVITGVSIGAVCGLVPRWRRPLHIAWMTSVFPIGWLVSHTILALVYYLVFTPIGLVLRLAGHDPMTRRPEPVAPSYWVARPRGIPRERYFRQF